MAQAPQITASNVDILDRLAATIGHTPLIDVSEHVGNGCRVFAKCEFENPTGSHYDRVYLELFRELEQSGTIRRGETHLVEVSSGSAGASFAWFCQQLGYKATLIMPKGILPTSIDYTQSKYPGMEIIVAERDNYIEGAVRAMQRFMAEKKELVRNGSMVCLDHSRNPITL